MRLLIALYFATALLNWGYLSQRPELWLRWSASDECAHAIIPVLISAVWPLYWSAKGARALTRPASSEAAPPRPPAE